MGASTNSNDSEGKQAQLLERARTYFEPQLRALGLSESQIENQNLPELEESLTKINDLIAHPDALGRYVLTASISLIVKTDAQAEVGPLLVLLERKGLILKRITALRQAQGLAEFRSVVSSAAGDPAAAEDLINRFEDRLSERLEEERSIQRQVVETEEARRNAMLFDIEVQKKQSEIKKQKSDMYRAWLERESIASIVGAVLLLGLGIAMVVAMFVGTATTEIVASSFLLILGYFFGQTTSSRPGATNTSS